MISKTMTAVCVGTEGQVITVETDISNGLPNVNIVGLASTVVMESRERIKSAIVNSDFEYPRRRVTINLTPSNLRKTGAHFDLPLAVVILTSMGYVNPEVARHVGIIGGLSLEGRVLPIDGVLPMVFSMVKAGIRCAVVPAENGREAVLASGIEVVGVHSLKECIDVINGCEAIPVSREEIGWEQNAEYDVDYREVRGQDHAIRAATIAAAGSHGLLLMGSPGCGKTMIAKRLPTILPPMTMEEMIEDTVIYSVMGKIQPSEGIIRERPFRSPHHSIGRAGLIGGGSIPIPGEITMAHNGVLFLDELNEFDRTVIESLRIPLEEKEVTLFRRGQSYRFPSSFLPVMAANPCKCGYYGDKTRECTCTRGELEAYQRKLSGALLDRIDLQVQMERIPYEELTGTYRLGKSSAEIREQVQRARAFAMQQRGAAVNSALTEQAIQELEISASGNRFLHNAYDSLHLSARTYHRTMRVARTIADLEESRIIDVQHISEALSYREVISNMYLGME